MDYSNVINNEKKESIETKGKCLFDSIRNINVLKKVLNNLDEKKSLDIIKYNEKIKHRLNVNINDYLELLPIEIEIKPFQNGAGKFININEKDKAYFHIYFNNDKEEKKTTYFEVSDKVEKIRIIIDHQIKSFNGLFRSCRVNESIKFIKFYRNDITDMSNMFFECLSLKELNLSNFNTRNVTDMSNMFFACLSLKELNLSNLNMKNVTNMCYMFFGCTLKKINLSKFDFNKITNMRGMFYECRSLEEINFANSKTDNLIDISYMFYKCSSLKRIDISNFNTNQVKYMRRMFYKCSSLVELKISDFNINNVSEANDAWGMFDDCPDEIKKKFQNIK